MYFQAMNGFMMMMTQNGKLLYISENAAEYLGHSMVCHTRHKFWNITLKFWTIELICCYILGGFTNTWGQCL